MKETKDNAISLIFVFIASFLVYTNSAQSKSLYAITDHHASTLKAYKMAGDELEYQEDVNVTDYALGAVDVVIDSNLEKLFLTYEDAGKIVWASAKTLNQEGFIDLSSSPINASELAGIVADEQKQRIYAVAREDNKLYILSWNSYQEKLILMNPDDPNQPYIDGVPYIELSELEPARAYGIALDSNKRRLYVGNDTSSVNIYNADDPNWTHLGTRDVGRNVADITVDPNNGQHPSYLYAGALYTGAGQGHTFLIKHNLEAESNPNTETPIGTVAIGLTVDPDTARVYVNTSDKQVRVYDCNQVPFNLLNSYDTGASESSGAGMCVPSGDVSYKPPAFDFLKVDVNAPNSVLPGDEITYEIAYGPNGFDHNNVIITDYLPVETDFVSATSNYTFNSNSHTVTWDIGDLNSNDPNEILGLTVKVNELAEPNGSITNYCEIETNNAYNTSEVVTPVACWSPDIIYVDVNAVGSKLGTSWEHAYTDLYQALQTARDCDCNEIWVAEGVYVPGGSTGSTYELVSGAALYGGFEGNEEYRDKRNWIKNKTVLDGQVSGGANVDDIVTAKDVNSATVFDGFTLRNGYYSGIKIANASPVIKNTTVKNTVGIKEFYHPYGGSGISCENNSSATIENCEIQLNNNHGIYSESSTVTVSDCNITENGDTGAGVYGGGIYCDSTDLNMENCLISDNLAHRGGGLYNCNGSLINMTNSVINENFARGRGGGICNYDTDSSSKIKNSIIFGNTADDYYGGGIYNSNASATISNVTFTGNVADEDGGAIYNYGSSMITNCVFWDNQAGGKGGEIFNYWGSPTFSYCTIEGGIDGDKVFGQDIDGGGNIDFNPCFYAPDVNNFHLAPFDSKCIDAGDPDYAEEPNETDIDGEKRIFDGDADGTEVVDIGADEFYWSPADFDANEIVNFVDFALLASAWQTSPPDPEYDDIYDLADNDVIDNNDLELFCADWLWQSAWGSPTQVGRCSSGMDGGPRSMHTEGRSPRQVSETQTTETTQKKTVKVNPEQLYNFLIDVENRWDTELGLRDKITEEKWLDFIDDLWNLYHQMTEEAAD